MDEKLVRMSAVHDAIKAEATRQHKNGAPNGKIHMIDVPMLIQSVNSIPAVDAVEVVRCADCKYCHIEDEYEAWCYGGLPAVLTRATEDFCSHGQRREDGDT